MASVQREGQQIALYLDIENKLDEPISGLLIRFDNNPYKLQPTSQNVNLAGVILPNPGQSSVKRQRKSAFRHQRQV
jgi:hypothetical protein